ncbi:alpha/beta fold hydrolase [Paenibacillus sp. MCAF9]|uniref:alpha/beta fold hydrolase n=1 Tax=unclassified Paenibacillus TaxID=185978 RepID=UPI003F99CB1A
MYQIEQNTINYAYPYSDVFATSVRLMQSEQPLTFVLVHGSWADASFWNGIGYELTSMGHTVFAPEYPGHGADPNKNVTHEMISHSVAASIASRNLQQIILVGHSFGGSVIQKVAELIPERIRRLVFLDAFVLNDGEMVADEFPAPVKASFQQLRENSKDDTIMLPFSLFRETFVNLASLGLAEKMYSMVSPEPAKPFYEKLDLKVFYSLNMPKSYIFLTEDNVLPQYNSEYGWHPHMSNRLGLFRYIQGHGDHMSTAKTHPEMLAHRIYEAGRD